MPDTLRPTDEPDVVNAVKWAAAEHAPLEIIGTATKRPFGRPVQAAHVLDLSALSGIINYEPAELIMTLRPGTPMAEVNAALDEAGQMLAFEPMDLGPLFGTASGAGTIGGVVSTNLSGPRRLTKGAARDHVLGVKAVSGRGELFKAGGYVVKNVTGYDLCKGLTGAFGTLGVMTELTVKTVPRPATEVTLALTGLDIERAGQAMSAALGSPHEVSAASHLPQDVARELDGFSDAVTLIRLEGIALSVDARAQALTQELSAFLVPNGGVANRGVVDRLDQSQSQAVWHAVRDCQPLAKGPGFIWRLSVPPMSGARVFATIKQALPEVQSLFDWAGGLIWLRVPGSDDTGAAVVRDAVRKHGSGHATLVRASSAIRTSIPVFEPQATHLAALSQRVKAQFDPHGILNPGRMTLGA